MQYILTLVTEMSWVLFQDKYDFVVEKNDKLEEQMASLASSFLSLKVGSGALLHCIKLLHSVLGYMCSWSNK